MSNFFVPFVAEGWYAVALSASVKNSGKGLRAVFSGKPIVLWRNKDGVVSVSEDQCPHMGASLSEGKVMDGLIVCPYHGAAFEHTGACVSFPANSKTCRLSQHCRLKTFSCCERYGLIWVYFVCPSSSPSVSSQLSLASAQTRVMVPFPSFPEFENTQYRSVSGQLLYPAEHSLVAANSCDFAHIQHVHPEFADASHAEVDDFEILETSDFSASAEIVFKRSKASGLLRLLLDDLGGDTVRVKLSFDMPSTNRVELQTGSLRLVAFVSHLPISPVLTLTTFSIARNFALFLNPLMDFITITYARMVVAQDRRILSHITPAGASLEHVHKVAVPADRLIIEYKKRRADFMKQRRCASDLLVPFSPPS